MLSITPSIIPSNFRVRSFLINLTSPNYLSKLTFPFNSFLHLTNIYRASALLGTWLESTESMGHIIYIVNAYQA